MVPRILRPNSAPPSHRQAPRLASSSDLAGKVNNAKNSVLTTLNDTDWPKESLNDVQNLTQAIQTQLDPDKLPKDEALLHGDLGTAIAKYLKDLEDVGTRVKTEARKYGTKGKGFRKEVKKLLSSLFEKECATVLRSCQNDVEGSSATLNALMMKFDVGVEHCSSQAARDKERDYSGILPATDTSHTASMSHSNAESDHATARVKPNDSPDQFTGQAGLANSSKDGQQEGNSMRGEWLNGANKVFKLAEGLSGALPVVGGYVGAVAKVGLSVIEMVQAMKSNDATAGRLGTQVRRLSDVLERVSKQSQGSEKTLTVNGMSELQRELQSIQDQIEELKAQRDGKKIWSSDDNAESLKNLQEQVQTALEEIQLLAHLNVSILVTELHNVTVQNEHRRLLDRLGDGTYGAQGNLIENVTCLPGTRVDVLEGIDNWIRRMSNSERVLWIRGMAGRGKSTIASTVANSWKRRAACAIFHFRRSQNKLENHLVCSLARQLGKSVDPELRNAIISSVRENEDIATQRLDEQFNALFVAPLATIRPKSFPILIVVDALDECDSVGFAVDFVKLIKRKLPLLPDNVKFLLTSRPEAPFLRVLATMEWRVESLDTGVEVNADIERFLNHGFMEIRRGHRIKADWPSPHIIAELVQMSQGLFQWARTLMQYVNEGASTARLAEILRYPKMWSGVDELYTQILSKALEKVDSSPPKRDLFLSLLGTLLATPHPISLEVVAFLHSDNDSLKLVGNSNEDVLSFLRDEILAGLNSLFFIPELPTEPIRLMHTSIRDLLVDRRRCGERSYWVDLSQHHRRLTAVTIREMNHHLKENICSLSDLSKPSSEVQDIVERELCRGIQYCCRSWSIHLVEGGQISEPGTEGGRFETADFHFFTEVKVLYWLEVMSLVGSTNEAMLMAKQVHQWVLEHGDRIARSSSLATLWNDIQRFITAFFEPISFNPTQIYVSALAHCPEETELWRSYGSHAKVRTIRGLKSPTWPSYLWTKLAESCVFSVAFSPEGTLIAAGRHHDTILLLDVHTGREASEPLAGHKGHVLSVCFSPDSKLLASGSYDCTVRLWDPQTGMPVGEPLIGHHSMVDSVCFSPDGKLLASGSCDSTIRLWDPQTGRQVGEPLIGHDSTVYSVCFSPDGKLLASGSYDRTIRLWDPQTGWQVTEPLISHTDGIHSVCFSPDGKLLASGSHDHTIRLWDPQAGRQVGEPLNGHSGTVSSVCFSPDCKLLASGSWDDTIRLWEYEAGRQISAPLTNDCVRSICFSPDSRLLASGSSNGTIRLWDHQIDMQVGAPLQGHNQWIWSVCFSPDSRLLASGSSDNTIRLWDTQTGRQVGDPLIGHNGLVWCLCFSPDSKLLASGSDDQTIRLWDPQTGGQVGESLTGHSKTVWSVCFSPDSKLLASGSDDQTIRLWDPQTSRQVAEPLIGCEDRIVSIVFSANGMCITGRAFSGNFTSWDTSTLQRCETPSSNISGPDPLEYEKHWVTFSSSRLFWLPSQYWIGKSIVLLQDGKLAVTFGETLSIFDISGALSLYSHLRV